MTKLQRAFLLEVKSAGRQPITGHSPRTVGSCFRHRWVGITGEDGSLHYTMAPGRRIFLSTKGACALAGKDWLGPPTLCTQD